MIKAGLYRRFAALSAAPLAAALLLGAVHAQEADPQRDAFYAKFTGKRVIFISQNQASEQGQIWFKAMVDTLKPLGVSVEVRDYKFDTSVGAQAFSQAIAQHANLIVAWSSDRSSFARLIQQASAAGIYTISMNMGSVAAPDSFIGPDWAAITRKQVDAAADFCKGKSGQFAVVGGSNNSAVDVLGMIGVKEGMKAHPELKLANYQVANWDANNAKSNTAAVLKQNPDLCAVVGLWNLMDLGAAAAISEAGLKGKVFMSTSGSGLLDGACDKIRDGTFDHYVSYNVQKQYTQIGTILQALLSSDTQPGKIKSTSFTELTDITKADIDRPAVCWTLSQFGL
jgi:ribose transport system substrate-binding protein